MPDTSPRTPVDPEITEPRTDASRAAGIDDSLAALVRLLAHAVAAESGAPNT